METCCSRFTAAEGGARLASVANIKNTIITEHCTFVATRLLHEDAYKIRGLLSEGRQRSIFLTRSSRIAYVAYELGILTDLTIAKIVNYEDVTDWKEHVEVNEVIVCTSRILKCILEDGYLSMPDINVLVIDSCHLISTDEDLKYVMRLYKECTEKNKPRLLALTYPIFTSINNINEATNNDEINRENKSDIKQIENNQTSIETLDLANEIEEINTDKKDFVPSDSTVIDKTIDEIDNDSTIDKNDVELKDKVIQHSIEKTDDESVLDLESSRNLDRTVACITEKGFESIKDKCKDTKDILGVYKNVDDFEMYEKLGWKIEELEKELDCEMDLAEDIDGGKRLLATITKPKEVIIEYSKQLSLDNLPEVYKELDLFMRNTIQDGIDFIKEHRYDPSEIYGEELYEEFINIPDPTKEPKEIFAQFLYILDELGPYAADKAAFCLLAKLEKLKIKVPYERHFLLLCMCTTILVKIRGYADYLFSKYNSDWEMIKLFCTPKVLRLTEILEQFRPMDSEKETNSPTNELDCIINETNRTITGDVKNETDHKINETNRSMNETGDVRNDIDLAKNKSDCNYETDHIINDTNRTINETGDEKNEIHLVKNESDCKNETDHKINEMNRTINETGDVKNEMDLAKEDTDCKNESNNKTNESELARNENNLIINETDHKVNETNQTINETGDVKNESDCKKEKNEIELANNETIPMVNETDHLINQIDHEINETNRIINKTSDVKNEIHLAKEDINCKIESNNKVNKTELARNETMPVINESDYKINETNRTINETDCKSNEIDNKNEINTSKTKQMLDIIENCDFTSLGNKIEDRVNTYESNLKELEVYSAGDKNISDIKVKDEIKSVKGRQRVRGRPRVIKNNSVRVLQNQNPDALCGIMFLREPLMAKILFMLLVDISRCKQSLSYICAQYCAVEVAGELQECQRQSRKQEDVLKKFRMHECNLLLATPILEEGIDLPRCNLVLRWDVPPSYRSHALCRGRARAPRSALALLAESPRHSRLLLHHLAIYRELDQIVTRKCGCGIQDEPTSEEESYADEFTAIVKSYSPMETKMTEIVVTPKNNTNVEDKEGKQEDSKESDVKNGNVTESDGIVKKVIKDRLERDGDININETERDRVNGNIKIKMVEADTVKSEITSDLGNEISENTNKDKVDSDSNLVDSEVIERTIKKSDSDNIASVDLSTAIALINRYCGKLPSDTFTRLAPQWWMEEVRLPDKEEYMKTGYICTLRLPLNCPVKYNIVGHPMPTRVLARRMVALQACRILHKSGELDNQLMPIGKENFKAVELEGAGSNANGVEPVDPNDSARPGTTKRRQYYYKRTAWAFTDCQPIVDTTDEEIESADYDATKRQYKPGEKRNTLYAIDSRLWCALPERYNTRGRRLHAPQHARQAIGILMARHRPDKLQIPAFPVYTRSGEVRVSVELAEEADVRLSPRRARLVRRFMRFVFSDVLRVRRRGMKLQSEGSTHNNYYIVPTVKTINEDGTSKVDIDWSFLELIFKHTEEKRNLEVEKPIFFQQDEEEIEEKKVDSRGKGKDGKVKKMDNPLLKEGETFTFDPEKYKEAVVTPWYRNQDQPQFFLVAEICWNLSPDSAFPSATHTTFRDYYSNKYGVTLTQPNQPLLDVDHTSARLNLLTPRYVNRKGVALPVSSERTRRAKRDRLDQKQILVPELCRVHPFAAPLWFATVALPCVLYRINALLIADEIRRAVAIDVGLGIPKIDDTTCPGFQWPPLDFGWSLAEVFSADSDKGEKKKDYDEDDLSEKEKDFLAIEESKEENLESDSEEVKKTINDILQEKEDAETCFEIGTWSNDMASSIQETVDFDEYLEPLPSNLTFCTSASGGANWNCPIEKPKQYAYRTFSVADSDCSYLSSDFDTDDTEMNSEGSDEDTDASGFCSSKNSNAAMGVRIEYKTAHEAEAVDVERTRRGPPPPQPCARDDARDLRTHTRCLRDVHPPPQYIEKFRESVKQHERDIIDNELLIDKDKPIIDLLSDTSKDIEKKTIKSIENIDISELFPYTNDDIVLENGQITIDSIEKNKRRLLEGIKKNLLLEDKMNCFSMKDVNIDSPDYVNEKLVNVGFDSKVNYKEKVNKWKQNDLRPYYQDVKVQDGFDFDYQPVLDGHPGPSPSVILQALTMSNANDGINLERLETIGDSFLKFAITAYLYCAHPTVHEGKLSHMRSKQVSNLNLYRLGRGKRLGARMTASKFEPHDNWLPPCHRAPPTLHHKQPEVQEQATGEVAVDNAGCFIPYNLITQHSIPDKSIADCVEALIGAYLLECGPRGALLFMSWLGIRVLPRHDIQIDDNHPYVVGHKDENAPVVVEKSPSPPTKRQQRTSESDSDFDDEDDESGDQIQLEHGVEDWSWSGRAVGSLKPYKKNGIWYQPIFGELRAPPSPLLRYIEDPEGELEQMLSGYEALEQTLQYRFKDRSLLLQALTHASHHKNRLTDCYQRLEFLGDAILDYLITRHLYEDARRHSPGALTDLRSALVNNTIFATLAARHGFHKYFRHMSPGLNDVLTKYVKIQEENGHSISEEHYLIHEDEMEQAEDVEVPKALGDLFESIAGAIFLDSGMSLGAVWRSYVRLMGAELEAFSAAAPKSPVRELLEAEPDTAKFGKPERLADGRRVRVCVEVFGRGAFKGVGRNYRIAKGTAARCALRHLKTHAAA